MQWLSLIITRYLHEHKREHKVVPLLKLSTMPCRHMMLWKQSSKPSYHRLRKETVQLDTADDLCTFIKKKYIGRNCSLIQTCTPDGHLYRVTYTRCRIDTTNSPDNGHMTLRNMQRIQINIHEKELCVKLVIYKDYTETHGQQNIKLLRECLTL